MKIYIFRKTRNGKTVICNENVIMIYLSISKETYWDAYKDRDEWNKHEKQMFLKS